MEILPFLRTAIAVSFIPIGASCSTMDNGDSLRSSSPIGVASPSMTVAGKPGHLATTQGAEREPAGYDDASGAAGPASTSRRVPGSEISQASGGVIAADDGASSNLTGAGASSQVASAPGADSLQRLESTPEAPSFLRTVQQRLNELGYNAGAVDGRLGPNTRNAIRKFQAVQGLRASGNLDAATTAVLGIFKPYDLSPIGANEIRDDAPASPVVWG